MRDTFLAVGIQKRLQQEKEKEAAGEEGREGTEHRASTEEGISPVLAKNFLQGMIGHWASVGERVVSLDQVKFFEAVEVEAQVARIPCIASPHLHLSLPQSLLHYFQLKCTSQLALLNLHCHKC